MKEINNVKHVLVIIENDTNYYIASDRKNFKIGDIFFDERYNEYLQIESEDDIKSMSFTAPEIYI